MIVRYAESITEEQLKELPNGAVISLGICNWEKLGIFWMLSDKNEYQTVDEIEPAVCPSAVAECIKEIMKIYQLKQFSILIPDSAMGFGEVVWVKEDVENAFEINGYDPSEDDIDEVICKIDDNIGEKMISTGWDVIYDAVEEVIRKSDKKGDKQ